MNRDIKIDLINVYEKLLGHKLPVKTDREDLKEEVQKSFGSWVNAQLDTLLGNAQKTADLDALTQAEIIAIRHLLSTPKAQPTALPSSTALPAKPVSKGTQKRSSLLQLPKEDLPIEPQISDFNRAIVGQLEELGFAQDLANMSKDGPEY